VGIPQGEVEPGERSSRPLHRVPRGDRLGRLVLPRRIQDPLYTYIRRGRKIVKTVTYFLVEVRDPASLARSLEHVEDPSGNWYRWGTFEQISVLLYHTKIRQVFAEAEAWLRT
jgi:hypothetical protein